MSFVNEPNPPVRLATREDFAAGLALTRVALAMSSGVVPAVEFDKLLNAYADERWGGQPQFAVPLVAFVSLRLATKLCYERGTTDIEAILAEVGRDIAMLPDPAENPPTEP